ncbi:13754_t:CDS:2 [Entrophospora sp. SA101]|nr:5457_t:CDS:2 [Entrophospora sp. SA101]CAJ0633729.1 13748_t:CDS:2 [Entrophospora sp. SA101]CAJ0633736.1 13754_t:CDS:2 [Entrophospora sp. SA101]
MNGHPSTTDTLSLALAASPTSTSQQLLLLQLSTAAPTLIPTPNLVDEFGKRELEALRGHNL